MSALDQRLEKSPRQVFLEYCARGELAFQRASDGRAVFFPRLAQAGTGDTELEWTVSAGTGVVYASTVVRPRGEQPHNVAMIQLDEGFKLMSAVVDVDPETVQIGRRVRVEMRDVAGDGVPLPVFLLTGDE
ncbi:Zn-ribbon domain-containing OB-fold protein [Rhodococcus opacus]|uniref:Zn-ribbon domain-containing OB-fold protein n=1 Tax=Rhodococcus opacus TaxID=37919 RepID=UPI001C490386|nr:OB-fold domain-containing protein [Rhodococcus opacus]MBV6760233.1 OB-fold domain-containing protein [Rhodococcus opacus]